jgi:hypothetical protein
MRALYSPREIADMVEFVRKCSTSFPIRVTVEQFFNTYDTQRTPTIVVTFDDDQSRTLAQKFSDSIELLDGTF